MSLALKDWKLCRYLFDSFFITGATLVLVSLLTMTSISIDRLLALSLGLSYRQVVTLKRTYVLLAVFWAVSSFTAAMHLIDHRITSWCGRIIVPSCLVTAIASYTKIFRTLRNHHTQVQNHVSQQPSQPNVLNIARYRKAVYSALWVQLALVVCYLPNRFAQVLVTNGSSMHFLAWKITITLVLFNSTLNPFLYCWKISEVRRAVKETIRQALCCPWS